MTDKELTARIAELNAQRAALKKERDKLAWEEGIPAIIAKMKRYGKRSLNLTAAADANICLSHNELWRNLSDGHFAVKQLYLDENDNLIVVFNALLLNEKSAMKDWVFDRENIKRSVDEEISNAVIAPLLSKLLDDAFYNIEENNIEEHTDFQSRLPMSLSLPNMAKLMLLPFLVC